MLLAERLGSGGIPRAGEDLRHGRGPRGPGPGPPRPVRGARGRRGAGCPARPVLPAAGRPVAIDGELRRAVIFGRHDLIQDAPISRVDLLICRNCLMYFNTEAQARILCPFPFRAGAPRSTIPRQGGDAARAGATFEPVDVKRRYSRAGASLRDAASDLRGRANEARRRAPPAGRGGRCRPRGGADRRPRRQRRARQAAAAHDVRPEHTGHRPAAAGSELSERPFELRSSIDRSYLERRPMAPVEGRWTGRGRPGRVPRTHGRTLLDTGGLPWAPVSSSPT